jgi:hypothetical protein
VRYELVSPSLEDVFVQLIGSHAKV